MSSADSGTVATSVARAWAPGKRFGSFEIVEPIGSGSYGIVYKATDLSDGKTVALKLIRIRSAAEDALLQQEFRRVSNLSHPNLVFPLGLVNHDGETAIVMEYVDGTDFLTYLRALSGARLYAELDQLLAQLGAALNEIHGWGLVHRDIKPANVLVSSLGHLVLVDYGFVESETEATGNGAGSLPYLAPEVLRGEAATHRADWFSVGAMFHEVVAGTLPWSNDGELATRLMQSAPPELAVADVPPGLAALVRSLLEPAQARRAGAASVQEYLGNAGVPYRRTTSKAAKVPFVGRRAELACLNDILAATTHAQQAIVHLHGAPGMGKSALLSGWMEQRSQYRSEWILHGRCHERDAMPYGALADVVGGVAEALQHNPHAQRPAMTASEIEALARVFPIVAQSLASANSLEPGAPGTAQRPAPPVVDPMGMRQRAFAALARVVHMLTCERVLVLILDDLQWGDADSAELIDALMTGVSARFMLVLSYRPDERDSSPFLSAFLARERPRTRVVEMTIGGLDDADAQRMVESVASAVTLAEVSTILARAEGCPFLLELLAASLTPGTTTARLEPTIPLREPWFKSRTELETETLRLVSIAGRPVPLDVLVGSVASDVLPGIVTLMRSERLLRTSGIGPSMSVDIYHARVRTVVLDGLDPALERQLHRRLAEALLQVALRKAIAPDHGLVARHLALSDEAHRAAPHAKFAALHAAERLAFEHAAELYQLALSAMLADDPARGEVKRALAVAFANAGRGRQAADLLLECAASNPDDARELRRFAVDQYLISGHLAAGTPLARSLHRQCGLPWPHTRFGARWFLLKSFVRLLATKPRAAPWRGPMPSQDVRFRIDLCASIGRGLSSYDAIRGPAFLLNAAGMAVRRGHDGFAAAGMGYLGFVLGLSGRPKDLRKAQRWFDAAEALAQALGDRRGHYSIVMAQGVIAMCRLRWHESLDLLDRAIIGCESECVGAQWEADISRTTGLLAAFYGGQMQKLTVRVEAAANEGLRRGDLALETEASLYYAPVFLAADDPRRALMTIERVIGAWQSTEFQFQHWIALRFESYAHIYTAEVDVAFVRRFARGVASAKRAGQLRMQVMRVEIGFLGAMLELRVTPAGPLPRKVVASLKRALRDLHKEADCPCARAFAFALQAALAERRGDGAASLAALEQARIGFRSCDMQAHVAATELRIAEHHDDLAATKAATIALETLGVAAPRRFAAMLVP